MIDWVNEACKSWGRCTRWILADTNEGYPSQDTIERARQGFLECQGSSTQYFNEVRVGLALEVATAMHAEPLMPEALLATLWAQYVVLPPKGKSHGFSKVRTATVARYLGVPLSLPEYWRNVDRAHYFLAARIRPTIASEAPRLTVATKGRSCTVP